MTFSEAPRHGHIGLPLGTPADLERRYSLREMRQLQYCHDDSETEADSFGIAVSDRAGHTSDVLTISVVITPVNDHQVKFVRGLQTTLYTNENGKVCLSLLNVNAKDEDTDADQISFEIVSQPRNGKRVSKMTIIIESFMPSDWSKIPCR